MATEYAPLFPLETQFQAKDGRNNTDGFLKVFLAGTDRPADTYSDYQGTRNPLNIVLDNNGRATVICDKDKGYRLEVYAKNGELLWTEEPVFCSGSGGGGLLNDTKVVSTDGSIAVDETKVGAVTTYDLSIAPGDSPEFLEWSTGFRGNMTYGSDKVPYYSAGTMTFNQYGIKVYKDRYYHITNKFFIKPRGTGINYETFEVALMLRDPSDGSATSVEIRKWDIDTSLTDEVQVEMSFDLTPTHDGELYWEFYNSLPKFEHTDAWIQIHRVYSGINAVPDTCATKQWVSSNYIPQSASSNYQQKTGMSAYVPYSAIDGDGGAISGINGSAISGMLDTSTVIPFSALEYNASSEITGISGSAIGGQVDSSQFLPASASGDFYPMTGNPSGFLTAHQDISDKLDVSAFNDYSANLDSALGDEFDNIHSALDDKMDKSASGDYYPMSGNPSGFITDADISNKLDVSAFNDYSANVDSALDDKLDVTAYDSAKYPSVYWPYGMSQTTGQLLLQESRYPKYVQALVSGTGETASAGVLPPTPSSNLTSVQILAAASGSLPDVAWTALDSLVSGKADESALSSYMSYSSLEYSGSVITAIDGSAIGGGGVGGVVFDSSFSGDGTNESPIGLQTALKFGTGFKYVGINQVGAPSVSVSAGVGNYTSMLEGGSVSFKNSTKQAAYGTDIRYYSAASDINASLVVASSDFISYNDTRDIVSSNSSTWKAKQDALTFGYDSDSAISSINGSSLAGGGGGGQGHEYSGIYPVNVDNTADKISVDNIPLCLESPLSAYMSGDSAVINIDLSNYQPSGAYIYESALGWAEV